MKFLSFLFILVLLALSVVLGFDYWFNYQLLPVNSSDNSIVKVEIKKGWSGARIGEELFKKGLIKNPLFFKYYLKFGYSGIKLKYGDFGFSRKMSLDEIITKLAKGEEEKIILKIIPGISPQNLYRKLARLKFLKMDYQKIKYYLEAQNIRIDKENIIVGAQYLVEPNTYFLNSHLTISQLIDKLTEGRIKKVKEFWSKLSAQEKKVLSLKKRLILASILEKEGRSLEEKKLIASVFLNRLKRKIKLESCATVQYILRENGIKRTNLTYSDLKIPSLYNTYLYHGLPPGIISIYSDSSLEAAFFPAETNYLYFVLQPGGKHHFSKTLSEHNRFKRKLKKWLKKEKLKQKSSR